MKNQLTPTKDGLKISKKDRLSVVSSHTVVFYSINLFGLRLVFTLMQYQ